MKSKLQQVFIYPTFLMFLVSCGGGNDIASSGATAVSAAAPVTSTTATASAPSKAATEPKANGQIDERTAVAPMVAQMTVASTIAACKASATYGGTGPILSGKTTPTLQQCMVVMPESIWDPFANGGCGNSASFGGSGPYLTPVLQLTCLTWYSLANTNAECSALGGKSCFWMQNSNDSLGICACFPSQFIPISGPN